MRAPRTIFLRKVEAMFLSLILKKQPYISPLDVHKLADNSPFSGCLDEVNPHRVKGWIYNRIQPNLPVRLLFRHNGNIIGSCLADQYRSDIAAITGYDGRNGFEYILPDVIWRPNDTLIINVDGSPHDIIFFSRNISNNNVREDILSVIHKALTDDININEFLSLDPEYFVILSFAVILNKDPSPTDLMHYSGKIRSGYGRWNFLDTLYSRSLADKKKQIGNGLQSDEQFINITYRMYTKLEPDDIITNRYMEMLSSGKSRFYVKKRIFQSTEACQSGSIFFDIEKTLKRRRNILLRISHKSQKIEYEALLGKISLMSKSIEYKIDTSLYNFNGVCELPESGANNFRSEELINLTEVTNPTIKDRLSSIDPANIGPNERRLLIRFQSSAHLNS